MKLRLINKKIRSKGLAVVTLKDDTVWGRSQAANVVIPDSRVSRLHIQILLKKKSIVLRCLSMKGIKINDQLIKMNQEVKIQDQDTIKFANSEELHWTLQTSSRHPQSKKEVKVKDKRREVDILKRRKAVLEDIEKRLQEIQDIKNDIKWNTEQIKNGLVDTSRERDALKVIKSDIEWNTEQIKNNLVDTSRERDALREELKRCKEEMQTLKEHMTCAICLDLMRNPVISINCGHSLCNSCLQTWKKEKNSCPICRTEFTQIIVNPNLVKVSHQMLPVIPIN